MAKYLIERMLHTIPVLFIVSILIFGIFHVMPGDPALNMAGENATDEHITQIRESLGLNQPIYIRYVNWVGDVLTGDFGSSIFTGRPVINVIGQRLEPTLSLAVCAMVITVATAIPLGVLAAWRRGSAVDRLVMGGSVLGFSIPGFFVGYVLVFLFSVQFRLFPVQGFMSISESFGGFVRHMFLPSLTVSFALIAFLTRVTRATMIEVLAQDYIRTAQSKGVSSTRILFIHALRNASIPIVTILGFTISLLLGGVIVTETVFSLPGMGGLVVESISSRDYPIIQGVILVFGFLYILVNLLVDLSYPILDPRIRK